MKNSPGKIHHADFVIDTNVIDRTKVDDAKFDQLLNLVKRMTDGEHLGGGWLPITALLELLATRDAHVQMQLLGRFHALMTRTNGRVNVLAPVPELIQQEWRSGDVLFFNHESLTAVIDRCLGARSIVGSDIEQDVETFRLFQRRQREQHEVNCGEFGRDFQEQEQFRIAVRNGLARWEAPHAFTHCDDLAEQFVRSWVTDPCTDVADRLRDHERHLTVWSFAFLVRLSQIAQTIPGGVRTEFFADVNTVARESRGSGARSLEVPTLMPHRNDLIDAGIAASAATCGLLITEDEQLGLRVNFLHAGNLMRTQAATVETLDRSWKAPPASRQTSMEVTDGDGRR